jgi:zinc protease
MSNATLTANVVREVLPNGLTILIERNATAPVVAAVTHVKAGYFDEPDEWVGIAHVLEHMFFKGTLRRGPGELARETQRLGGYLNAGTIYDKTLYYTALPSGPDALATAVDLQSDALMHSTIDAEELRRELEVIIQEVKRKLDTPASVASETLHEVLFNRHRIRRWRIGTEEGLRRLTADDVRQYYRSRYTPGRVIVGLVGDLDPDEALGLARDVYGSWEADDASIPASPAEEDSPPAMVRVLQGDVERPIAVLGWRSVSATHPDVHALDAASSVLGSGRGSWLSQAVRSTGLASSASGSHYTPTEVGVFNVTLEGDASSLDAAVERALELTDQLGLDGPSATDMERVRSLTAMLWSRRLESMEGRASLWCTFEALGGLHLVEEFHARSLEVTAEQVQSAASRYVRSDGVGGVIYLRSGGKTRFADAWPPAMNGKRPPPKITVLEPREPVHRETVRAERIAYEGDVVRVATDGADLLVRAKPKCGLVALGVYGVGLRELETEQNAGISFLLARSAARGAGGMTAEQLALAAEQLGGTIVPNPSLGAVGWNLTVRAEALPAAVHLLRAVAQDSTLAGQTLAVERDLQVSDAARARDDMFAYPLRRTLMEAFPGTVYGLPGIGDPEVVRGLTDDIVRAWADQLRSRRLAVVAVGDLETDQLIDGISSLGDWPGRATPQDSDPVQFHPGRGNEERDKAQSALAMAFACAPYAAADRYPAVVTASLLSGMAGRLFDSLRDKRSLAYTVTAMPWLKRRVGAMLTYIATSPEREDEARQAMLEELGKLPSDEITADELDRARSYAAGVVQMRQQSAHAVASEVLDAWLNGDLDTLAEVPERLREVTETDVRRTAEAIFKADERAEYVVRGTGGSNKETG